MIEHSRRHAPHTFAACLCGREPVHVEVWGSYPHEPLRVLHGAPTTRHQLHCPCCRRSTGLHVSLALATNEWGQRMTQLAIPLPPPKPARRRAA